ncbi:MAG: class III poly(R)-hydroxyalkanoic acid synthase subunit PhaC [Gammaproteobacteria bacterium]|nr:class III poly(R)-hydroxyalkanoic acid synthase subunit PhaC [Gammaproteobacteria bacterium]
MQRAATALESLRNAAGVQSGGSERDAVYREDKLTLYRYRPLATSSGGAPLLIVYALVNRPTMLDLQPDRSLIRRLLERGLDVYLIDWGRPDGADRLVELDDYINGYLARCVRRILAAHGIASLNLLGICQGGTFSLCHAALHPQSVRNLITMATPVDFHTPDNLLSTWLRGLDVDALVSAWGIVPGELLNNAFLALQPVRLAQQKYVHLWSDGLDAAQAAHFMRMEKWIFDSPGQAGVAFAQFVRWFYQENRLAAGTLAIGGRGVDLGRLRMPVLNLSGTLDHIVPPSASEPLGVLCGSRDYTARSVVAGHIGLCVSARAQREVPEAIECWLRERDPRARRVKRRAPGLSGS